MSGYADLSIGEFITRLREQDVSRVHFVWDAAAERVVTSHDFLNDLAEALTRNPRLEVLLINGLYDLASGNVMFAATGVTNGTMLKGVRRYSGGAMTHSVVMRSKSGTVRYIEAQHNFDRKTGFEPADN